MEHRLVVHLHQRLRRPGPDTQLRAGGGAEGLDCQRKGFQSLAFSQAESLRQSKRLLNGAAPVSTEPFELSFRILQWRRRWAGLRKIPKSALPRFHRRGCVGGARFGELHEAAAGDRESSVLHLGSRHEEVELPLQHLSSVPLVQRTRHRFPESGISGHTGAPAGQRFQHPLLDAEDTSAHRDAGIGIAVLGSSDGAPEGARSYVAVPTPLCRPRLRIGDASLCAKRCQGLQHWQPIETRQNHASGDDSSRLQKITTAST